MQGSPVAVSFFRVWTSRVELSHRKGRNRFQLSHHITHCFEHFLLLPMCLWHALVTLWHPLPAVWPFQWEYPTADATCDTLLRRRELVRLLQSKPWGDKSLRYHLSREEEYRNGLQATIGIWYGSFQLCSQYIAVHICFALAEASQSCSVTTSTGWLKGLAGRRLMKEEKITQEDALELRKLLSLPGGFELHIGVRCRVVQEPGCLTEGPF